MGVTKKDLINTISESNINPETKKELVDVLNNDEYRDTFSRKMSSMMFKNTNKEKSFHEDHTKLSFEYTEEKFLKNCISIVKKL